jgi:hypothetical protein
MAALRDPFNGAPWRVALSAALLLAAVTALMLMPDAASAATASTASLSADDVRWGLLLGLAIEAGGFWALSSIADVRVKHLVTGQDGRLSTSKTIAVVWTLVVAAALFAVVFANLLNEPHALTAINSSGIVGQYALLFGGPLGAALLAKGIVTGQVNKNPAAKPPTAKGASVADLFQGDGDNIDLGDCQYVLFNLVALVFVVGTMLHAPAGGLPHIPDVLLGLTSVSATGYVGKKALPATDLAKATIDPNHGPNLITVNVTGLSPETQAQARFWVRVGDDDGHVVDAAVATGAATLQAVPIPAGPVPGTVVAVSVVTQNGALLSAGNFTY